jgi:hypothetical protein
MGYPTEQIVRSMHARFGGWAWGEWPLAWHHKNHMTCSPSCTCGATPVAAITPRQPLGSWRTGGPLDWIASVRFTHDSPDFLCSSVCLAEPMPLDPTRMNDCQVRVSDDNQLCARTVCGWCSHGAPLVNKGGVVSRRGARYYPAFGSKSRHSICTAFLQNEGASNHEKSICICWPSSMRFERRPFPSTNQASQREPHTWRDCVRTLVSVCSAQLRHAHNQSDPINPSMHIRRETDDGFGCGMGLALTVSTGVKMGIRGLLLRRHHPQRVRL